MDKIAEIRNGLDESSDGGYEYVEHHHREWIRYLLSELERVAQNLDKSNKRREALAADVVHLKGEFQRVQQERDEWLREALEERDKLRQLLDNELTHAVRMAKENGNLIAENIKAISDRNYMCDEFDKAVEGLKWIAYNDMSEFADYIVFALGLRNKARAILKELGVTE